MAKTKRSKAAPKAGTVVMPAMRTRMNFKTLRWHFDSAWFRRANRYDEICFWLDTPDSVDCNVAVFYDDGSRGADIEMDDDAEIVLIDVSLSWKDAD